MRQLISRISPSGYLSPLRGSAFSGDLSPSAAACPRSVSGAQTGAAPGGSWAGSSRYPQSRSAEAPGASLPLPAPPAKSEGRVGGNAWETPRCWRWRRAAFPAAGPPGDTGQGARSAALRLASAVAG